MRTFSQYCGLYMGLLTRPRFWIEQSCSKVIHFSPPFAPPAANRSEFCGKASSSFLQVVGVHWSSPPPQVPLKSARAGCRETVNGSSAPMASANVAMPSIGTVLLMTASLYWALALFQACLHIMPVNYSDWPAARHPVHPEIPP